jgi:hypothetical protein
MGFRLFLGVTPSITNWSPACDEFSLQFETNPLTEFVELPDHCLNLKYANVLTGVIRGACEMVKLSAICITYIFKLCAVKYHTSYIFLQLCTSKSPFAVHRMTLVGSGPSADKVFSNTFSCQTSPTRQRNDLMC